MSFVFKVKDLMVFKPPLSLGTSRGSRGKLKGTGMLCTEKRSCQVPAFSTIRVVANTFSIKLSCVETWGRNTLWRWSSKKAPDLKRGHSHLLEHLHLQNTGKLWDRATCESCEIRERTSKKRQTLFRQLVELLGKSLSNLHMFIFTLRSHFVLSLA